MLKDDELKQINLKCVFICDLDLVKKLSRKREFFNKLIFADSP